MDVIEKLRTRIGALVVAALLATAGVLIPAPAAHASGGDHVVDGTGCWQDTSLFDWYSYPYLEISCLQIDASEVGGGSGTAKFSDSYANTYGWDVAPLLELQLDCVFVEEASDGHVVFASGTDAGGNRGWLTVRPTEFTVTHWSNSVAPCGAPEYSRQISEGGFTIGHTAPTANSFPTPDFTSTCTGLTCTLDASSSTDPDGQVIGYRWYIERKWYSGPTTQHSGRTVKFELPQANLLGVKLIVTDDDGGVGSVSRDVNVGLPVSQQAAPSCKGLTCTFDASLSTDPDGTVAFYHWNLYDDGAAGTTDTPLRTHTYSAPGTYYTGVRVEDDQGNVSPWMDWVKVEVTAPPLELAGKLLRQGQKYLVDLSWSGSLTASVDVFRNGVRITTISKTNSYSETVIKGSGTLTYKVCDAGSARCSNDWSTIV